MSDAWTCPDCNAGNTASAPHCATCGVIRAAPVSETWATRRIGEWRASFKTIDRSITPDGVDINRWRRFLNDCAIFINNGRALQAVEMGWDEYQLFAADRYAPLSRVDQMGVLWFVRGATVLEVTPERIAIQTRGGATLNARLKGLDPNRMVLPWDMQKRPTDAGRAARAADATSTARSPGPSGTGDAQPQERPTERARSHRSDETVQGGVRQGESEQRTPAPADALHEALQEQPRTDQGVEPPRRSHI